MQIFMFKNERTGNRCTVTVREVPSSLPPIQEWDLEFEWRFPPTRHDKKFWVDEILPKFCRKLARPHGHSHVCATSPYGDLFWFDGQNPAAEGDFQEIQELLRKRQVRR